MFSNRMEYHEIGFIRPTVSAVMIQLTGLDKYLQAHLNSATLTLVITGCKKSNRRPVFTH